MCRTYYQCQKSNKIWRKCRKRMMTNVSCSFDLTTDYNSTTEPLPFPLRDGLNIWRRLKTFQLSADVPEYDIIMIKSVCAGDYVYGKQHRHDPVLIYVHSVQYVGIVETIFAHYATKSENLLLIWCLDLVDPDPCNQFYYMNLETNATAIAFHLLLISTL